MRELRTKSDESATRTHLSIRTKCVESIQMETKQNGKGRVASQNAEKLSIFAENCVF